MKKSVVMLTACFFWALLSGCQSQNAKNTDELIGAIGEVGPQSGAVIAYVRDAVDVLSQEEKESLKQYDLLLSTEAAYVDSLIYAIGSVTPESKPAIETARQAYDALEEGAKTLVEGEEILQKAEADCLHKTKVREISGIWVNEVLGNNDASAGWGLIRSYGLDETDCNPATPADRQFILQEDGSLLGSETQIGTWTLSDTGTEVILDVTGREAKNGSYTLKVLEEGGYTKLIGSVFGNQPFGYVQEQNYLPAFQAKYAILDLTKENIREYLSDPVPIGTIETAEGKKHTAYWYAPKAYERDLVYLGSSCIVPVDYEHGGKTYHLWLDFPVLSTTNLKIKNPHINSDSRLSGEIFYIKADYVADNYINPEGYRVLELTNGIQMIFNGYEDTMNTFWNRIDVNYSDFMY